jgi:hypothetical protein
MISEKIVFIVRCSILHILVVDAYLTYPPISVPDLIISDQIVLNSERKSLLEVRIVPF